MMGRHTPDICERDNVFLQVDSMLCVVCRFVCMLSWNADWVGTIHSPTLTRRHTHILRHSFAAIKREPRADVVDTEWDGNFLLISHKYQFMPITAVSIYLCIYFFLRIRYGIRAWWFPILCVFFLYYWLTFSLRVRVVDQRQQLANDIIALLFLILLSSLWWDYMGQLDWNSNGGFCMSPMQVSHMKLFIVLLSEIQIWSWFEPIVIQWHAESSVSIPI